MATTTRHIEGFHKPYLKMFKEHGWKTYVVTGDDNPVNDWCDFKYCISLSRSPFEIRNIKAILELKKIIEKEKFNIIHCHTPMGSVVTRMAANNARKKAMILQKDDLAHMVIKYCMQSFGLRGKDFIINDDEFILIQKRIEKLNLSAYEMIEVIAYAAMVDIYKANELLYANHQLLIDVVDYMLNERYISELKDTLDNFSGIIDNKEVSTEKRYSFYDASIKIDENFSELKRNDPDYIK